MNRGYENNDDDDDEGFNRGKFFNFLFFKKSVKIKVDQVVIRKVLNHWKDSVYYLFVYKYIYFKGGYSEQIESIASSTCEKELVYLKKNLNFLFIGKQDTTQDTDFKWFQYLIKFWMR